MVVCVCVSQRQKYTLQTHIASTVLFHCTTAHKMTNKIPKTPEIYVNDIFSA